MREVPQFSGSQSKARAAAVAGLFYPGEAGELGASVDVLLSPVRGDSRIPKAVIVPHAGYVYSGAVAASAYALIATERPVARRFVIVGPSHRHYFRGLAVPSADAFATPLGLMRVDAAALQAVRKLPQVIVSDDAHALEHSLEVQLPFLQRINPDAQIVPVAVGDATAAEVEAVIDLLWGGPETHIIVSSDLSHYHPYRTAQAMDRETVNAILHGQSDLSGDQACGCTGINGLVRAARHRGLRAQLLDLRNSGDTAGDKLRVVGYAAFGFFDA